jgi:triacylglycerol lipase
MSATMAFAGGGSSNTCDTRYPMVLAHGMFAHDDMLGFIDYWWGIEDDLEDEGCDVYITSVNGMDSTANKGVDFNNQVLHIPGILKVIKHYKLFQLRYSPFLEKSA